MHQSTIAGNNESLPVCLIYRGDYSMTFVGKRLESADPEKLLHEKKLLRKNESIRKIMHGYASDPFFNNPITISSVRKPGDVDATHLFLKKQTRSKSRFQRKYCSQQR